MKSPERANLKPENRQHHQRKIKIKIKKIKEKDKMKDKMSECVEASGGRVDIRSSKVSNLVPVPFTAVKRTARAQFLP